jgi:hypothetical protein
MPDDNHRLAVPDSEVWQYLGLQKQPTPTTISLARKRGAYPPNFYVLGRSFVLLRDIEQFLEERRAAAETEKAPRAARMSYAHSKRRGGAQ